MRGIIHVPPHEYPIFSVQKADHVGSHADMLNSSVELLKQCWCFKTPEKTTTPNLYFPLLRDRNWSGGPCEDIWKYSLGDCFINWLIFNSGLTPKVQVQLIIVDRIVPASEVGLLGAVVVETLYAYFMRGAGIAKADNSELVSLVWAWGVDWSVVEQKKGML